jgi:DNA-binding transcriptional ArsR family regulator
VIEIRMAAGDLTRLRFGYSPLVEVIDSLNVLHARHVHPVHRRWADETRQRLSGIDTALLAAITPPRRIALTPPFEISAVTSVQHQLRLLAEWPPEQLRAELETVWRGQPMPPAARDLICDGPAGARRLAAALIPYWDAAIAPYWDRIRAVLEADIAYRARQAVIGGISVAINDLHPQLRMNQSVLQLSRPASGTYEMTGNGLLLMPSVFGGQYLSADLCSQATPYIAYSPRGIGTVWERGSGDLVSEDPVSAVIGKGRAAILRRTGAPATTTDLAAELKLSGATVSVHLSALRRCGLLISWRSGRQVFYQRTTLGTSIIAATERG